MKLAHEIAALDLTGLSETDPRQVFNLVIPVLEGTSFEDAENAIYFAIHLLVDQEAADHLSGVSDWYAGRIMLDIHKEDRVFQGLGKLRGTYALAGVMTALIFRNSCNAR